MKKINFINVIQYVVFLLAICFLKSLHSSSIGYDLSVKDMLIYWEDNQFVNLIWFTPILLTIYILTRKSFYFFNNYDVRFRNRDNYIKVYIARFLLNSIVLVLMVVIVQMLMLNILFKINILLDIESILFILRYMIENIFLVVLVLVVAFYFKNLMYGIVLVVSTILLLLIMKVDLIYVPFVNLYYDEGCVGVALVMTCCFILLIKMRYKHLDIGGIE